MGAQQVQGVMFREVKDTRCFRITLEILSRGKRGHSKIRSTALGHPWPLIGMSHV